MRNVNKIFITFGLLVIFLVGSVWQFLQTETFANIASRYIQTKIIKKANWNLEFAYIDVDMFPPATKLKRARFKDEKGITIDVDSLGLFFSFWDLISSDWSIEKIGLEGGELHLNIPKDKAKKTKKRAINLESLFEIYSNEVFPLIPFDIKKVQLNDLDVYIDGARFYSEKTLVRMDRNSVSVETTIFDFKSSLIKVGTMNESIDQVQCKASLSKSGVRIYHFDVKDRLLRARFNGGLAGKEYKGNVGFEVIGDISDILRRIKQKDLAKELVGTFRLRGQISGALKSPTMTFDTEVKDFKSNYANGKRVKAKGGLDKGIIYLDSIDITTDSGSASLAKRFNIFDLGRRRMVDSSVLINSKALRMDQALVAAGNVLEPIKGFISGGVEIAWDKDVRITVLDGTVVNQFSLDFAQKVPVLKNDQLTFRNGLFIIENDGPVLIRADLAFGKSSINVRGSVEESKVSFRCASNNFDFNDFGPISGVQITGSGKISANISGPHDDVVFTFNVNQDNVEVFDFNLGKITGVLALHLRTLELDLKKLKGKYGGTDYSGKGKIGFYGKYPLELAIDIPRGSYKDSQHIYKVLLEMMDDYPKTLSFTYSGRYKVSGTIDDHQYVVDGSVRARNVWWLGEEADRVRAKFHYENDSLSVNDIMVIKKEGTIQGELSYDYRAEGFSYDATFKGIRCKDIFYYRALDLGLDGEMEGSLKGESNGKDFSSSTIIKVVNSRIGGASVRNSLITVYNNKSDLFVNGNIIGDLITFDSFLNLTTGGKKSYVNISVISEKINVLSGILSEHNYKDQTLKGRFIGNLTSKFRLDDIRSIDLLVDVDDFRIKKGSSRLIINKKKSSIVIKRGVIEKWDLEARGGNQVLKSQGEGSFGERARIINDFNLDNKWATIVTPYIESASGKSFGNLLYIHRKKDFKLHMRAEGKNVGLKIATFPDRFKKISYKMILDGDELLIDHVQGSYGGGKINADGNVIFKFPLPVLDISFDVARSKIAFFEQSSTSVSASGKITGSTLPYSIVGEVNLQDTNIYDDMAALYKMMGVKGGASKYLPTSVLRNRIVYYNYDVNTTLRESAHVKNSMLDLFVVGSCHLGGTLSDLKLDGEFLIEPNISKVKFTGREFVLTEGGLKLGEKNPPRYSLVGSALLNEYNIKLDASGESEKIDIKLTSEPSLSQQDIVSLLTLGVTSDISQNLENEDRQSVTSVGLGALLVDQLNINEGLNQSLGMQLSVMPEFEQNEDASMLSGRTEGSNVTAGTLKSATKIKLQKKILGVDVSVSSTVGGSMKQKQEMKVKWNLMKNISLEGIYEIKDSDDEEIDTNESVGADVKIRWSF